MAPVTRCWVVTDGKAGMENQCVGLAEALGCAPIVKRVSLRAPWRQLTPYVRIGGQAQFTPESSPLTPPWPDLLIATGRHSIAASILVRRLGREAGISTFTVQLQDPLIDPAHFDLVIVPRHDETTGANVLQTKGALHRVTAAQLEAGAVRLFPRIAGLPRPFIAVLLGGSNGKFRLEAEEMKPLSEQLAETARVMGGSLLITPSRRTSPEGVRILKDTLSGVPHFLWDGEGENPYFGILGAADVITVTCDSINMVSEAASTGKPVYVIDLPGGSARQKNFHLMLRADGVTRSFKGGALETYAYTPLNDMAVVTERLKALLKR